MSVEIFTGAQNFLNSQDFFDYSSLGRPSPLDPQTKSTTPAMGISDYLVAFSTQSEGYCVACVDMQSSTKISASLPAYKLSKYYEVFLNSMSKIIGKFGGKVIKNIGDCLLYYFENSKDFQKNIFSRCLDCGITMRDAQPMISEYLVSQDLPAINYRISADYGYVIIMNTTDSSSIDMIGPPVNMCAKINHYAGCNEFVIGGDFHEIVKKFPDYSFKQVPSCNIGLKRSYPVYRVN